MYNLPFVNLHYLFLLFFLFHKRLFVHQLHPRWKSLKKTQLHVNGDFFRPLVSWLFYFLSLPSRSSSRTPSSGKMSSRKTSQSCSNSVTETKGFSVNSLVSRELVQKKVQFVLYANGCCNSNIFQGEKQITKETCRNNMHQSNLIKKTLLGITLNCFSKCTELFTFLLSCNFSDIFPELWKHCQIGYDCALQLKQQLKLD